MANYYFDINLSNNKGKNLEGTEYKLLIEKIKSIKFIGNSRGKILGLYQITNKSKWHHLVSLVNGNNIGESVIRHIDSRNISMLSTIDDNQPKDNCNKLTLLDIPGFDDTKEYWELAFGNKISDMRYLTFASKKEVDAAYISICCANDFIPSHAYMLRHYFPVDSDFSEAEYIHINGSDKVLYADPISPILSPILSPIMSPVSSRSNKSSYSRGSSKSQHMEPLSI